MENMDNILDSVDNPMTVSDMIREKESVHIRLAEILYHRVANGG
jgi:hypothetical protein